MQIIITPKIEKQKNRRNGGKNIKLVYLFGFNQIITALVFIFCIRTLFSNLLQ